MNHFRMLRTFAYVLNFLGWLKLAGGIALAILVFWQPSGWEVNIPHLLSAPVTALAFLVLGIFMALLLMACAEHIVWMLEIHDRLGKIQEFFGKAK